MSDCCVDVSSHYRAFTCAPVRCMCDCCWTCTEKEEVREVCVCLASDCIVRRTKLSEQIASSAYTHACMYTYGHLFEYWKGFAEIIRREAAKVHAYTHTYVPRCTLMHGDRQRGIL
jgi:hypothetical protein